MLTLIFFGHHKNLRIADPHPLETLATKRFSLNLLVGAIDLNCASLTG